MEQNISGLLSEDKEIIRMAAETIKNEGDIKIVPVLFELLQQPDISHSTEAAIADILADIRDTEFKELLHSAIIEADGNAEYQAKLVRICWESPMNFSNILPLLCEITSKGEFIVAMEASTAIEEQIRYADHDMLHELHNSLLNSSQQNSPFAEDVLNMIESQLSHIHSHHEEHDEDCDCHECKA